MSKLTFISCYFLSRTLSKLTAVRRICIFDWSGDGKNCSCKWWVSDSCLPACLTICLSVWPSLCLSERLSDCLFGLAFVYHFDLAQFVTGRLSSYGLLVGFVCLFAQAAYGHQQVPPDFKGCLLLRALALVLALLTDMWQAVEVASLLVTLLLVCRMSLSLLMLLLLLLSSRCSRLCLHSCQRQCCSLLLPGCCFFSNWQTGKLAAGQRVAVVALVGVSGSSSGQPLSVLASQHFALWLSVNLMLFSCCCCFSCCSCCFFMFHAGQPASLLSSLLFAISAAFCTPS